MDCGRLRFLQDPPGSRTDGGFLSRTLLTDSSRKTNRSTKRAERVCKRLQGTDDVVPMSRCWVSGESLTGSLPRTDTAITQSITGVRCSKSRRHHRNSGEGPRVRTPRLCSTSGHALAPLDIELLEVGLAFVRNERRPVATLPAGVALGDKPLHHLAHDGLRKIDELGELAEALGSFG